MKAKEKYTGIIQELIRNEAVTDEKLDMLVKKFGANKKKTSYYLRSAGVIEKLGKGVNRVLIRDKDIEPYVDQIAALATPYRQQKSEPVDMSLPGKWTSTEDQLPHEVLDMPDTDAAEDDIGMHAKVLEMMNGLDTKIINQNAQIFAAKNQIKTFIGQTNTNKQNEYIAQLEQRITKQSDRASDGFKSQDTRISELEEKLNNLPSVLDAAEEDKEDSVIDSRFLDMIYSQDKRVAENVDMIKSLKEEVKYYADNAATRLLMDDAVNALKTRIENMQFFVSREAENMVKKIISLEDRIEADAHRALTRNNELDARIEKLDIFVNRELENAFEKLIDNEDELRIARDRDVELEKRIEEDGKWASDVEQKINLLQSRHDKLEKRVGNAVEKIAELENVISEDRNVLISNVRKLNDRMNMCIEDIQGLDDKIDSQIEIIDDKLKEQTLIGSKNGMLKALHTLLGELI